MKKIFISVVIFMTTYTAFGSDTKFRVADIPPELTRNAKAVIRFSDQEFRISSYDKAVLKMHYAITVLNENGLDKADFIQFFDKFRSVRNIQYEIYDKDGQKIKHNIGIDDYSAISGFSLYEDTRIKYMNPDYRTTPFTIEYSFEIAFDGLFNYPSWYVYEDYNISVVESSFRVTAPLEFKFRYLEQRLKEKCQISEISGTKVYNWKISGCPAIRKELYSHDLSEYTPSVLLAPDKFKIGNSEGNCESWQYFGDWMNKLNEGRGILSDQSKEQIRKITGDASSDIEKVSILYNYLQNKVRYVNIKMGLGGWQTIEAEKVERLSYGDCKALSNYMKALLDAAGIKSCYTLIYAGENAPLIRKDFPSNQFNHAMLCIPLLKDTIWLECTSQHIPCGFLGSFTDDRYALAIDENGGHIVKTPLYGISDNTRIRKTIITLNQNGNAETEMLTDYKGIEYDNMSRVLMLDDANKKKYIQENLTISNFNIESYNYTEERNFVPVLHEKLKLTLPSYATVAGSGLFFSPVLSTRLSAVPPRLQQRNSDIFIRRSFSETDTIIINLPDKYTFENKYLPQKIKSKFGEYWFSVSVEGNRLIYIRNLKMFKGEFPTEDYPEFVDFLENIKIKDDFKLSAIRAI